jgi:glycosyltransferase involved in cell wall biosynthesis
MSSPLVSIVLPTFNGSRFLEEAVESIIAQTYSNWELILVDDASTDKAPDIISLFRRRDPRILSLRNLTNRRLPGSLNAGFARTRGELLTWTSDDNCYRPGAIQTMVAFLRAHPEADFVYTNYSEIDAAGAVIRPVAVRDPALLAFHNAVGPCFLYRRRVFEETGPYAEDLFLAEDYDYWLRTSCRFRLARLPEDLYLYRMHGGSLTAQRTQAIRQAHEQTLTRNLSRMRWLSPGLRALAHLELACQARKDNRRAVARRMVILSLRQSPGVMFSRQRQKWARQLIAETDPALASIHSQLLSRSVSCKHGFMNLASWVGGGDTGVRWSDRLRYVCRNPLRAIRKGGARVLNSLARVRFVA